MLSRKFIVYTIALFVFVLVLFVANLFSGIADINILDSFLSEETSFDNIIINYRLNKTLAALLAGISLSTGGFLMQELFKNPIADPSILGVSSSASLGVSLIIFLGIPSFFLEYEWLSGWIIILTALLASLIACLLLLYIIRKIPDNNVFIIIGFLIGTFCSTIVSILQFYSPPDTLKQYIVWSFGSFGSLSSTQITTYIICVFIGIILAFSCTKKLQGFILGEQYAKTLGINIKKLQITAILSTCILAGSTTAILGPIVFIGIIIPHFCRQIWNPSFLLEQLILNILSGATFLLIICLITEKTHLPVNILSSIVGIPIIIGMIVKNQLRKW